MDLTTPGIAAAPDDSVSPRRILVVDDDPSIRRLVATILRRERYDVETAGGGREALAKIELTLYDVIVLDLMMPEVSGLDVLKGLNARVPQVRCVVILSAGSPVEIASSVNANVFAALQKPFNTVDLIGTVQACIDGTCGPSPAVFTVKPVKVAA